MIEDGFAELLGAQHRGVLVTLKKDGRPQLSNVTYGWDAGPQTIRISVTDDRAKTANLRRDPRASFHVTTGDFWSYVVAEGQAELSAVARDPHDAAVEELAELYRIGAGRASGLGRLPGGHGPGPSAGRQDQGRTGVRDGSAMMVSCDRNTSIG